MCSWQPPKSKVAKPKAASVERPPTVSKRTARTWAPTVPAEPPSGPLAATGAVSAAVPRVVPTRPVEELVFEEAIRALEPLLSETDRAKYRMILTTRLSATEKALVWKYRRTHGARV